MKRFLATSLIVGVCSTFGFVGCAEESKVKEETKISTPEGTTTIQEEKSIKQTGENPPPATAPVETVPAPK